MVHKSDLASPNNFEDVVLSSSIARTRENPCQVGRLDGQERRPVRPVAFMMSAGGEEGAGDVGGE